MNAIEANYKRMAKIWHAKGRKAFNDAIYKQEIPNWDDFFEETWKKFTIIKLKCPCGYIKEFKINFDNNIDIFQDFNGYTALMCISCGNMIEIDKWEMIK